MVSPSSVRISVDVLLLKPPNIIIPCGDAHALCLSLLSDKLWDSSQEPVLERVWQDVEAAESSPPPHAVSPVCVWAPLLLGRLGREQILLPLVWRSSTDLPTLPLGDPPDTRITANVSHQTPLGWWICSLEGTSPRCPTKKLFKNTCIFILRHMLNHNLKQQNLVEV